MVEMKINVCGVKLSFLNKRTSMRYEVKREEWRDDLMLATMAEVGMKKMEMSILS